MGNMRPVVGDGPVDLFDGAAGVDRDGPVGGVHAPDTVEPLEREDHRGSGGPLDRKIAAGEAGAAASRHDGDPLGEAVPHHRGDVAM